MRYPVVRGYRVLFDVGILMLEWIVCWNVLELPCLPAFVNGVRCAPTWPRKLIKVCGFGLAAVYWPNISSMGERRWRPKSMPDSYV